MLENHPVKPKSIGIYFSVLLIATAIMPTLPQLDFIAAWQDPENTLLIKAFQFFSDSVSFFSLGIPVGITVISTFKKESNKNRSWLSLLYILLSIAIAGLISAVLKRILLVPRPYEIDARIIQFSVGGSYSLPSGHTTEAFASAVALMLLFPKWYVIVSLFCWASLVALSRIYLGVHYPFDILVGMLIGSSISVSFYFFVFRKYLD